MRKIVSAGILTLSVLAALSCGARKSSASKEIILFAAASTTDLCRELADIYTAETGVTVRINAASSGTLAKQIDTGAPADLFVSANSKWIDFLDEKELLSQKAPFAGNRLVVIVPEDSDVDKLDFTEKKAPTELFPGRLAMGDPLHVPAGRYAKEALESLGWYDQLTETLLPTADVRAALAVVELGECPWGIVYETDSRRSNRVRVAGEFPARSHSPITYGCALLNESSPEAGSFYNFFFKTEARELLSKYGFTPEFQ